MGLDIGISTESSGFQPDSGHVITLENDGYYWFLHEFFLRIRDCTGGMIDLYDDASFVGAQLEVLEKVLSDARKAIESKPNEWDQLIGFELVPSRRGKNKRRTLSAVVKKRRLDWLVGALLDLVVKAQANDARIVCFGD